MWRSDSPVTVGDVDRRLVADVQRLSIGSKSRWPSLRVEIAVLDEGLIVRAQDISVEEFTVPEDLAGVGAALKIESGIREPAHAQVGVLTLAVEWRVDSCVFVHLDVESCYSGNGGIDCIGGIGGTGTDGNVAANTILDVAVGSSHHDFEVLLPLAGVHGTAHVFCAGPQCALDPCG